MIARTVIWRKVIKFDSFESGKKVIRFWPFELKEK